MLALIMPLLSINGQAATDRPNILMILVDDLRPELGCYGAAHMVTPNIDRLAGNGMLFERAYTAQAVCLPSRISLFSGQYPQTTGVTNLQQKYWQLHENPMTLTRYLRENGYRTIALGKVYHDERWQEWDDWTEMMNRRDGIHRSRYASPESAKLLQVLDAEAKEMGLQDRAYRQHVRLGPTEQTFGPDENYHDYDMTSLVIDKLQRLKDAKQPFFLNVGYRKPHLPFVAPKRFWDLYDRESLPMTTNPEPPAGAPEIALMTWGELRNYRDVPAEGPVSDSLARELTHGYYACVSYVDAQVGRLLAALESTGLSDSTLVVLWGDHGWKLGDHGMWCKHTNYEIDTHIPLIVKLPDSEHAGARISEPTETIDIYPTICEFLGLEVPESVEGQSFAYLFEDPSESRQELAYSEYERHAGITGFSMKQKQLRYTEWIHLESGEIRFRELYNHAKDPQENFNIIDDPAVANLLPILSENLHLGPAGRYAKPPEPTANANETTP